eukprot:2748780-Rhodomonas_salina.2
MRLPSRSLPVFCTHTATTTFVHQEHSDHGLYFDNAAPIHRFPPSHLVIPHAPARTVSVDDSPVIDPDPPPRIRREPSDIEDQVVALPDQPPPLVRNVTDNDIDDDVEPAVEEDLKLDRHRSDISVVADLPDKTAGWEVKEWTSDFKNARPSSAKAKRGGGWQPEGGTIQMQVCLLPAVRLETHDPMGFRADDAMVDALARGPMAHTLTWNAWGVVSV